MRFKYWARFWLRRFTIASLEFITAMIMAFAALGYLGFMYFFKFIAPIHKKLEDMP